MAIFNIIKKTFKKLIFFHLLNDIIICRCDLENEILMFSKVKFFSSIFIFQFKNGRIYLYVYKK